MYAYRIVNVFTVDGDRFSGNPLCVFEDARGLSDHTMQALARQMNLSETTFVLPPTDPAHADARVRIFTPSFEMPFAGHPTLGTASVIGGFRDRFVSGMLERGYDAEFAARCFAQIEGFGSYGFHKLRSHYSKLKQMFRAGFNVSSQIQHAYITFNRR